MVQRCRPVEREPIPAWAFVICMTSGKRRCVPPQSTPEPMSRPANHAPGRSSSRQPKTANCLVTVVSQAYGVAPRGEAGYPTRRRARVYHHESRHGGTSPKSAGSRGFVPSISSPRDQTPPKRDRGGPETPFCSSDRRPGHPALWPVGYFGGDLRVMLTDASVGVSTRGGGSASSSS